MTNQAKQRHELELTRFRAERQLPAAKEAAARAVFELRGKQEELMGHEHGLAGFLARFTGRREEKLEALRLEVRHAEAQRDARRRDMEELERTLRETEERLNALPDWPELNAPEWERKTLAGMLECLLEENYEALEEARKSLRGERAGQIMSRQEFQEFYGAADRTGEGCAVLLKRLHDLGGLSELPPYYQAPTAYTANAATTFIRLDRVNEAMDQCLRLQSAVRELLQTPDPDDSSQ